MWLQSPPTMRCALLLLALSFLLPSVNAQASWQSMVPTTGRAGGGFFITVFGLNFVTTAGNTYRCVFTQVSAPNTIVVTSTAVTASSATRVVCTAPAFPGVGNAVMTVITQTGSNVIKSGTATSVFVYALPVASISGPAVFVMGDCGTVQMLTLTVSWSHPTSNLGISSTRLLDIDTGAVITTANLSSYSPAKSLSVNFTWAPPSLSFDNVSRLLNFSVVVSEVDFASPNTVMLWRQVRWTRLRGASAAALLTLPCRLKCSHLQNSSRRLPLQTCPPPRPPSSPV